jgi:Cu/Zn superoxide dismutase
VKRVLESWRGGRLWRPASFMAVALATGLAALTLLPAGAQAAGITASAPQFVFQTLDHPADLTFKPAVTVVKHLTLKPMPYGTVTFSRGSGGHLTVRPDVAGLTPGSAHAVQLLRPGSASPVSFGTLTANQVGQAHATLHSSHTGGIPSGSILVIRDGTTSGGVPGEPMAKTAALSGIPSSAVKLTAAEVSSAGVSYGPPQGTATITYNPDARTLTVVVNASGLTPGAHAAHIHTGSCQSQGPVKYMLIDFVANAHGKIVNETRTVSDVRTPIPASGWYFNLHQGNHSNILTSSGTPTIFFRPLLCSPIS